MSRYWNSLVAKLDPYVPGEQPRIQNLIKLNTNEHPYGPSPKVIEAIQAHTNDSLRLYPDPTALELRQAIGKRFHLSPEQVFVGNGSDEVLAHVFHALLKHEAPVLFPDITYSFYPVYCGLYEIQFKTVPLDDDLKICVDDYLHLKGDRRVGGIIFPNPNAPTGAAHSLDAVEKIIAANQDVVVVVDEAYVDFGAQSAVSLINKYPNLLVVHTLSKSRSLAGLRVGYAMGHADLIQGLDRVKNSFNSYPLDRLALAGATAAIEDQSYFEQTRDAVVRTRGVMTKGLEQLGFQVLPSAANFIFAKHPARDGAEFAAALREKNIIVRHFKKERIDQYLRITVGTDDDCSKLLEACKLILS
ncbi:histidinol-phosphate transaminase [Zwartia sp.]|uniref:histidinol-phosphate transaminase n=1 Tax=Zwartia sp. TaxID=2978004 RepID=UPI003BAE82C5